MVTNENKALRTGVPIVDEFVDDMTDVVKDLGRTLKPAARRTAGGQRGGQKPAATPDKPWSILDVHLVGTAVVLTGAAALRWADMSGRAWLLIGVWAAYLVALSYWLLTARSRRTELAQIVSVTVRGIKEDPRFIRPTGHRWRPRRGLLSDAYAGRVYFRHHEVLRTPSVQRALEAEFWTAFRARVTWPETAKVPFFDWVEVDAQPARGETPAEEAPDPEAAHEEVRLTIEDDLHKTMKLKDAQRLEFRVVERDEQGPLVCTLRYPAGFQDGSPEARYLVQERISAQYGGLRFVAEWDRRAEAKRLTLRRRPPLPKEVPFRFPAELDKLDPMLIPIGLDEAHVERCWNLRAHPHMIFAGATGAGKSYTLAELVYQLLIRGWQLILIDGKGTTFAPFRRWPGVIGYGLATDPESMADWMERGKHIAEDRYRQVVDQGVKAGSFPRLMVIIDELTEANEVIGEWWDATRVKSGPEKDPTDHPALGAWKSIPRKGRECGVHLLLATQQPNASEKTLGSTETRLNLAGRFFLGPTDKDSAFMMFGRSDIGRDVPDDDDSKGLGTLKVSKDEPGVEVKTYFTPRPTTLGEIEPEHREFFDQLMPLVEAAQAKVKRVSANGGPIDRTPDPRLRDDKPTTERARPIPTAETVDVFALADLLRKQDEVECWLDGEFLVVVEVIGDDEAEITCRDAEGKLSTLAVDDSARFELRGQS